MGENDMTTATLKKVIKFSGVQSSMIVGIWPVVEELVEKGLDSEQGFYDAQDILGLLKQKKMQLWVAIDAGEKKIVAVMVTQIAGYPKGKACWLVLVGGAEMDGWIKFMKIIKAWAKHEECDRILSFSRDGWIRRLAPYGFKKMRTLIECSLENENENL